MSCLNCDTCLYLLEDHVIGCSLHFTYCRVSLPGASTFSCLSHKHNGICISLVNRSSLHHSVFHYVTWSIKWGAVLVSTKASHWSTSYDGQRSPFPFPSRSSSFLFKMSFFFLKQHPIMSACPKAIIPFLPFFCPPFFLSSYLNNLLFSAMGVPHWLSSEP